MFNELIVLLQKRFDNASLSDARLLSPVEHFQKLYLTQLKEISDRYSIIINFMETIQHMNPVTTEVENKNSVPQSMYLHAFYDGVNKILDKYHYDLHNLEKDMLWDQHVSVSSVLHKISHMFLPLDCISQVVHKIMNHQIIGARILEQCHFYLHTGIPSIIEPFKGIQHCCYNLLWVQIKTWILYGNLLDPHKEFFIQRNCTENSLTSSQLMSFSGSTFVSKDGRALEEEYIPEYMIVPEFLPSVIPFSVANKILFIGETVLLFSYNPEEHSHDQNTVIDITKYDIDKQNITEKFNQFQEDEDFHNGALELTITDAWLSVNKKLRKLADEVGDLPGQLKMITDIYLLGRGELFQEFLFKAKSYLNSKAESTASINLNTALENAAYYVYLSENIDFLERVHFVLPAKELLTEGSKTWSVFRLKYRTPWPLHLIFTSSIMKNYNEIFRFLLRLKKAEMDLTSVWMSVMYIENADLKRSAMILHNHLLCLINNLQNYLYVDVISSELEILEDVAKKTDTFSEIQKAHSRFQANIISQSFLYSDDLSLSEDEVSKVNSNSVHFCLTRLINMCQDFSELLRTQHDYSVCSVMLSHIYKKLHNLIEHLISLVLKINTNCSSNHIHSLILRLDYNGYFMKNAHGSLPFNSI